MRLRVPSHLLLSPLLAAVALSQSGCGYKIVKANTDFVLHSDAHRDELIAKYSGAASTWQAPYNNAANPDAKKQARNDILNDLMWLADDYYGQLTNQLHNNNAWRQTLFDAAKLGLSAAGSVAGDAELKAILAATSTGIQGLNTSIDKNFYAQQSVDAIIAAMDSQRADDKKLLVTGMGQFADQSPAYPLSQGLLDAQKYALDSTLTHALIALSQKAAAAANTSRTELTSLQLRQYELNLTALVQTHQAVDQVLGDSSTYSIQNLQQVEDEGLRQRLAVQRFMVLDLLLAQISTFLQEPALPDVEREYFRGIEARITRERAALRDNFSLQ